MQTIAAGNEADLSAPTGMNSIASPFAPSVPVTRNWAVILVELFKVRLTALVLLTTMAGFYIGALGNLDAALMLHTVLATALLASGGAALNEFLERDYDARMRRTQERPLPAGHLQPVTVLWTGSVLSLSGILYLFSATNITTGVIGSLTLLIYIFVYTPLKRVTWLNTLVGAVPGALPPLLGWTAARGSFAPEGLSIFAIQALWQIPHFMAIAWLYRDDYARAGFKMLPVLDPSGRRTAHQALLFAGLLLPASIIPFLLGLTGAIYPIAAFALGVAFLWCALLFSRRLTTTTARLLFLVSVIYLPVLLSVMVLDKAAH